MSKRINLIYNLDHNYSNLKKLFKWLNVVKKYNYHYYY